MRVVHFTETWKPVVNGIRVAIDRIRRAWQAQDYSAFVVAPYHPGGEPEADVFRLPSLPIPGNREYRIVLPCLSLTALRTVAACDVFHLHHLFLIGVMGRILAWIFGKRCVLTFHTYLEGYAHYLPLPKSWARWFLHQWARRLINTVDGVVAPSRAMEQYLRRIGVTSPITVIPTGVDVEDFAVEPDPELVARFGIDLSRPRLISVGRQALEKNPLRLYRVFQLLRDTHDVQLIMVGDGPARPELDRWADDHGLSDSIVWTGMVNPEVAARYYTLGDIFVSMAETEAQGLSTDEAMAAERLVVVVSALGSAEAVTDGIDGLLLGRDENTSASDNAAADRIRPYLDSPADRKRLGRAAQERVRERSAETMVTTLIKVYRGS